MITAKEVGLGGTEDDFVEGGASEASDDDLPSTVSFDLPATESESQHDDDDHPGAPQTLQKRKRGVL